MASFTVTVQRNDHLAEFDAIFVELGHAYMTTAVNIGAGAVQRIAPVRTGRYRGSIVPDVLERIQDVGSQIVGLVYSTDNPEKVRVLEEGHREGIGSRIVRGKVYAVHYKKTQGQRIFGRAWDETESQIYQLLNIELPQAIAARL